MSAPPVVTTVISPVCRTCGIIKKSGSISCCGNGGSWFGNCGSAANANLGHTWYEGIRACKALLPVAVAQKLHAAQAKSNASFDNTSTGIDFKTIALPVNGTIKKSMHSALARVSMATSSHTSPGTLFTAGGCQKILRVVTCISVILTIVCGYQAA